MNFKYVNCPFIFDPFWFPNFFAFCNFFFHSKNLKNIFVMEEYYLLNTINT